MICPHCESPGLQESIEATYVEYGPEPVKIPVTLPVLTCGNCNEQWTDYRGEELRDAAVRSYLVNPTSRYHVGQAVLRLMSKAAGYWPGTVAEITREGIVVRFSTGIRFTMTFQDDPHLVAADDPSVPERLMKAEADQQAADEILNKPLWKQSPTPERE